MAKFFAKSVVNPDTAAAVNELREKFTGFPIETLIFFASHKHASTHVAALMKDSFPGALTFGCSSYAELGDAGVNYGSIVALAFAPDALGSIHAVVAENVTARPEAVNDAFDELERQNGCCKAMDFDYRKSFGMILIDGRDANIEALLGRIGDKTDVFFIGGCASDDFSLTDIHVYYDGKSYEDAAILAVVKPNMPFTLLKTQSAAPIGPVYEAGGVVDEGLTVRLLDGRPAAEVFAEGIGVPVAELYEDLFISYAFGLMVNGEPFIRAGRCFNADGSISFFGRVAEGQHLSLLRAGDIVASTAKALDDARSKLGSISAIVDFDCAHRDLTLVRNHATGRYAELFKGIEVIGLATFCEVYIANINQSSVMAVFA